MRKNVKVSIVVPCYNVEQFLSKCIESLINQTYKNIEIICINDGSKDKTIDILKNYSKNDKRLVIIDKKNAGVSSARNDGIKKSTGDYILFVDSDDYVSDKIVEFLLKKSLDNDADIVKCNRADVYLKENYVVDRKPIWDSEKVFTKNDFQGNVYTEFFNRNKLCNIWMTLIKREILVKNKILFDENLAVNEDEVFAADIFSVAEKFVYSPEVLYFYVKNDNGLSTNGINIFKRYESRKKHSIFIENLAKKWKMNNSDELVREKISFLAIHTLSQTAAPNTKYSRKEQLSLFKNICKDEIFKKYIRKSKGKIMLFPERILLIFVKLHLYWLGFVYARMFERIVRKYRYKLERLRRG